MEVRKTVKSLQKREKNKSFFTRCQRLMPQFPNVSEKLFLAHRRRISGLLITQDKGPMI